MKYYEINEGAAERAKDANSYDPYKKGSATHQYRAAVDEAARIAEDQDEAEQEGEQEGEHAGE